VALEGIDRTTADLIRILILTGARKGETLAMEWKDLDLDGGLWVKPAHTTKTDEEHRVPLNRQAWAILRERRAAGGASPGPVWPGVATRLKRAWPGLLRAAGITNFRIHDLRHSFASVLVGAGESLPKVGALLGHTQASTTQRYSHLAMDAMRESSAKVGDAFAKAAPGAERWSDSPIGKITNPDGSVVPRSSETMPG
jgi:integrase